MNSEVSKYKYEDVFTSSSDYARRFSGETGQWMLTVQDDAILSLLAGSSGSGGVWLDVGAGHGQLCQLAKKLNFRFFALVSHIDAFSNLRSRTSECHAGVVSDLLQFSLRDKSFEIVTSVRLISHCDEWRQMISELCRVSSDKVLIDYPPLISSNLMYRILFPIKKLLEGNTRTFTIFSHSEIEQEFSRHGFKLQGRRSQFFWPMVLHRKINSVRISRFLEGLAASLGLQRLFGNPSVALFARKEPVV